MGVGGGWGGIGHFDVFNQQTYFPMCTLVSRFAFGI